jgi:hypothetical protein
MELVPPEKSTAVTQVVVPVEYTALIVTAAPKGPPTPSTVVHLTISEDEEPTAVVQADVRHAAQLLKVYFL